VERDNNCGTIILIIVDKERAKKLAKKTISKHAKGFCNPGRTEVENNLQCDKNLTIKTGLSICHIPSQLLVFFAKTKGFAEHKCCGKEYELVTNPSSLHCSHPHDTTES
jgi:hypothetical protein